MLPEPGFGKDSLEILINKQTNMEIIRVVFNLLIFGLFVECYVFNLLWGR